ncbi:MAG: hypothetical protein KAX49_10295 [Halanaerobiales bacterium]|nr:hypothetical protein [Halanaerobiales bacterium]
MKKILLLTALIIVAITLGVSAEQTPYWDHFMNTAQLENPINHGFLSYFVRPIEFSHGHKLNNGMESEIIFSYGVSQKTEFSSSLSAANGFTNLITEIKHKMAEQNGSIFSILGRGEYLKYTSYDINSFSAGLGLL